MPHDCLTCKKPVEKKPHESVNRYNHKKFCSQACAKKFMKEKEIGWFAKEAQTIKRKRSYD